MCDVVDNLEKFLLAVSKIKVFIESFKLFNRTIESVLFRHLKHIGSLLRAKLVLVFLAGEATHGVIENTSIVDFVLRVL
jgi:hypothetical protein